MRKKALVIFICMSVWTFMAYTRIYHSTENYHKKFIIHKRKGSKWNSSTPLKHVSQTVYPFPSAPSVRHLQQEAVKSSGRKPKGDSENESREELYNIADDEHVEPPSSTGFSTTSTSAVPTTAPSTSTVGKTITDLSLAPSQFLASRPTIGMMVMPSKMGMERKIFPTTKRISLFEVPRRKESPSRYIDNPDTDVDLVSSQLPVRNSYYIKATKPTPEREHTLKVNFQTHTKIPRQNRSQEHNSKNIVPSVGLIQNVPQRSKAGTQHFENIQVPNTRNMVHPTKTNADLPLHVDKHLHTIRNYQPLHTREEQAFNGNNKAFQYSVNLGKGDIHQQVRKIAMMRSRFTKPAETTLEEPPPSYFVPRARPVNNFTYTKLLSPDALCDGKVEMIIIVITHPKSHYLRATLRRVTKNLFNAKSPFRLAFMLGRDRTGSSKSPLWEAVEYESKAYNDIIAFDFLDTYRNLSVKSIMMLKWASQHCNNAKYLVKMDDDVFLNAKTLRRILKSGRYTRGFLGGHVTSEDVVHRDDEPKWDVTFDEYPYGYFPSFAHGPIYVMSMDVVHRLFKVAPFLPMIHLEDVFVTGILARAINVFPVNLNGMSLYPTDYDKEHVCSTLDSRMFAVHDLEISELEAFYTTWCEGQSDGVIIVNDPSPPKERVLQRRTELDVLQKNVPKNKESTQLLQTRQNNQSLLRSKPKTNALEI